MDCAGPCFWLTLFSIAIHCTSETQRQLTGLITEPLCCLQSVLSSVRMKEVKASSLLWNNATPFCRTICIVCFSFLQQRSDRGGGDGAYRQTDRQIEQMAHTLPVPINLWLSLQLFLTCTRWPNHQATPKSIWLGNSHRWHFIPSRLPEQHTNTANTQTHPNITHLVLCSSISTDIFTFKCKTL